MAIEDDDKPRKKVTHEIGQDLSLLSVEELTERIALMTSEIERLQTAVTKKRASRDAASSFFKSCIGPCPGRGSAPFRRCAAEPGPKLRGQYGPRICSAPLRKGYALRRVRGAGEPLGQWPTWQTKAEKSSSFTID